MGETEKLEDMGYLQDIISYIFDEKKIVTYKWISNTLAVHVNKAKQLLYTFIKHLSECRLEELKVIYLVGGILQDDKGCRMQLTSEEDLEKVKMQFKVITSQHIYSVCLKNSLSDLHDLCLVDGVKDSKVGRHGAIKCAKGVSRSSDELTSNRQGTYVSVDDEKQWPSEQSMQKQSSSEQNEKKSSKPAGSISSMFSAQSAKAKTGNNADSKKEEEEKGENTSSSDKKPVDTKNASKGSKAPSKGSLAAMFSAQSAKPKPIKKDTQEENKLKNEEKASAKDTLMSEKETKSENKKANGNMETQEKSSKSKASKSESKNSKQKKRKASGSVGETSKRRKRIVMMDESDSSSEDDIFGSDEESSPAPTPSPIPIVDEEMEEPVETVKSKEPEQEALKIGHHVRKRKLVDKTFEDEDGYIVTKKVYEYVSGSESENGEEKENDKTTDSKTNNKEPEQPTKETKEAQKSRKGSLQKKNSPPEKKKQATIMSFFKRN